MPILTFVLLQFIDYDLVWFIFVLMLQILHLIWITGFEPCLHLTTTLSVPGFNTVGLLALNLAHVLTTRLPASGFNSNGLSALNFAHV